MSTWVLHFDESRAEPGQLKPVSAAESVDPGVNSEFTLTAHKNPDPSRFKWNF